nr:histidine phosphatase family protein [Eubacterium sp.]
MKHIYLIRHGRQSSKLCNVDVDLDKAGKEQAKHLAKRLRGYDIHRLYCSGLKRAVQTADIIGKELGLSPEQVMDFKEIDFGDLTGLDDETVAEKYADFRRERAKMDRDLPYPGGESGEDVIRRVYPELRKICEEPGERIAIVTHGGVIRALCAHLLQTDLKNKLRISIDLENTSITEIIFKEEAKEFYVERVNDYAHLENHPELLRSGWKSSLIR